MNQFTQQATVTTQQTAKEMGSGTLEVLATPALIAFMENTAMKLITGLPDGETSVGTSIDIQHVKASAVGENISCTATLIRNEGRKYTFQLEATDSKGEIIGKGTHERFVVNEERFMSKIQK